MGMRQVAMQMVKYPHRYYKYIEFELLETGESYDSYCYNVYHSNIWGDDLIAGVIGDMWNITITILSPEYKYPMKLWHTSDDPDVIIVANGGSWLAKGKRTTHFNGTHSEHKKIVGADLINPKLIPIVLDSASKAKQIALKNYIRDEEEKSLDLLRTVSGSITRLDDRICDLIHESDELLKQKKTIEYNLEQLGMSTEKIQEAAMVRERPYVRRAERERADELKRKQELEREAQKEEERKHQKTIELDHRGDVIESQQSQETGTSQSQETGASPIEIDDTPTLPEEQELMQVEQAKAVVQSSDSVLAQAKALLQRHTQQEPQQPVRYVTIRDDVVAGLLPPQMSQQGVQIIPQPQVFPQAVPSTSSQGKSLIQTLLLQQFMPQTSTTAAQASQQFFPQTSVAAQGLQQRQKQINVVIEKSGRRPSALRMNRSGPVPEELRIKDKPRYYCDECPANFSLKNELSRHKREVCQKLE